MSRRAGSRRTPPPPKRTAAGGRPLIGVTGHLLHEGGAVPRTLVVVNEPYLAAVRRAGGLPVVLQPVDAPEEIEAILARVDGLLFTGGQDVHPRHFGQAVLNETVQPEPDRDAFELPLIRAAVTRDVPLLAVCRGCQVLNVALGGSLWQDLPAQRPDGLTHRQRAPRDAVTHGVRVVPGSLLEAVLSEGLLVLQTNTFHHQAVRDLAPGLVVSATCTDGTVEAIEAPGRGFVLGVQWHPESLAPGRPEQLRLFQGLVSAASGAAFGRLPQTA